MAREYYNHGGLLHLKGFDLNLLTVFEMVFLYTSVSRAAAALGTTPSAVSQSLQKLRQHFDDPLFVREGKGISPTALGVCLHEQIARGLSLIDHTLNATLSAKQRRKFVIFAPCCLALQLLPATLAALEPLGAGYELLHYSSYGDANPDTIAESLLTFRKVDVVFSPAAVSAHAVQCHPLASQPLVLVCRDQHPRMAQCCSESQLASERMALLQRANHSDVCCDSLPATRVVLRSDSFISILETVSHSDLLTLLPREVARRYGALFNLRVVETTFSLPTSPLYLTYNKSSLRNSEFRSLLDLLLASMPGASVPSA
ncbi:HTH-type transcriptional regulator LeuO [Edwardsiella tarda]|uniref:LysR family transcriptional regulator n=1 Tax=Edwardsiella tarda ATCC 15947 = NBRC 105688 TaxID=667121 RepID=A0AC61TFJ7_EDWTA|nr:LysR family transcriptional regulator [Edwardsiella tarda]UAL57650.1 LysR family transcriptional regulator [Edwardsiella tarda]UCP99291.1 LysR family transcriptional regulator [Edwardsiella tarda ATCC 15947 = NBRC 105688]STD30068.1 HTH-type transcriptional regulator LeuO [Edwardsiella tarda]